MFRIALHLKIGYLRLSSTSNGKKTCLSLSARFTRKSALLRVTFPWCGYGHGSRANDPLLIACSDWYHNVDSGSSLGHLPFSLLLLGSILEEGVGENESSVNFRSSYH